MIVSKFGGSSVADADQIRKVKAILESDERRMVAVVSAPGKRNKEDQKITDLLYKCNSLVQKGQTCRPVFNEISKRFIQMAQKLKVDDVKLSERLDDIRCSIDAGRGADYAASRGEYLSALVISEFLGWEFLDAEEAIGINQDSTVNEATYQRLAEKLEPGKRYVIPGFYGETDQGVIKTFTRGGSDITGSIVARAIGAELYENWTDVSGIYRADPRIVEDAEVIPELSYKEVRELSDVGASVFHEEAIAPIYSIGIPIVVKNRVHQERCCRSLRAYRPFTHQAPQADALQEIRHAPCASDDASCIRNTSELLALRYRQHRLVLRFKDGQRQCVRCDVRASEEGVRA